MIIKRYLQQPAIITTACKPAIGSSSAATTITLKKTSFNQKLIIQFLMESFNTTTKRSPDFVFIINIFIIWCLPLLPMSANLQ